MTIAARLIDRLAWLAGFQRATAGGQWHWPAANNWGNGDRGPPGSWQMNRNSPHAGLENIAFSAVYACINTIASDIAKLPVQVFEVDNETGAKTARRDDYYVQLLARPNDYMTRTDFMFCFVQSYLFQGNSYVLTTRNRRGEIDSMHVLNPYKVQPLIAEDGSVFYKCGEDFLAGVPAGGRTYPARDIIHHRLPLLPGYPLIGVTPIFAAAASSAVGLSILRNSQTFFANSSRPSGMLVAEQKIPAELAQRMKQDWDEAYRGGEYGKTALLSGGVKWEPLTITAQDAQLLEQLRYSVEDVARVFRVPPFMLGDMTKVTYRNTEQLGRAYLSGCLGSHLEPLEMRFASAFDFGKGFEFKFDLAALLRTEIDVRYDAYGKALGAGFLTINEVRSQEGMSPVDGGDEPHLQVQMTPLSLINEPPPPPPPPPPPEPPPEDDEEEPPADDEPDEEPPAEEQLAANVAIVRSLMRRRRLKGAAP